MFKGSQLWFQYGFNMVSIWFQYGFNMGSIWSQYGFNMVSIWFQICGCKKITPYHFLFYKLFFVSTLLPMCFRFFFIKGFQLCFKIGNPEMSDNLRNE